MFLNSVYLLVFMNKEELDAYEGMTALGTWRYDTSTGVIFGGNFYRFNIDYHKVEGSIKLNLFRYSAEKMLGIDFPKEPSQLESAVLEALRDNCFEINIPVDVENISDAIWIKEQIG